MTKNEPTPNELNTLLGDHLFTVWQEVCSQVEEKYDMENVVKPGAKLPFFRQR